MFGLFGNLIWNEQFPFKSPDHWIFVEWIWILLLCVVTAAPYENRWQRFTADKETGFTVEMHMLIEFD